MKAIGPRAKKVMDALTVNCPNLCDHDKFHTAPYMDVVVEHIGHCNLGALYSIAHYYEQEGDLMRDPEMCFIKGGDGEYYPYYYRLDGLGIEQETVTWDREGNVDKMYPEQQRAQAAFANEWMRNIKEQQERVVYMTEKLTLILNRKTKDLWIDINGQHCISLWDVTGVRKANDSQYNRVGIFCNGRQIGVVWDVEEIKEVWK